MDYNPHKLGKLQSISVENLWSISKSLVVNFGWFFTYSFKDNTPTCETLTYLLFKQLTF